MNANDLIKSIQRGTYGDYTAFGFPEEQLNPLRRLPRTTGRKADISEASRA